MPSVDKELFLSSTVSPSQELVLFLCTAVLLSVVETAPDFCSFKAEFKTLTCTFEVSFTTSLTATLSAVGKDTTAFPFEPEPVELTEALSFSLHSLEELDTDPDLFLCLLLLRRLRDLSFSVFSTVLWVFTANDKGGKLSTSGAEVLGGLQNKTILLQ